MAAHPPGWLSVFLCFLCFATPARAAADDALPDSLLTEDYLYEYTFTDFNKARRIIDGMRLEKKLEPHRLDIAEGDLYYNTGRYHQGLRYYKRALESDAVLRDDAEYMGVLHRMISCYDGLHDATEQVRCTELLLEKARAAGNTAMESVALFNMGKMLCYQEDAERGYGLIRTAIELMERSDYKYKYDNLRYNYNTLLVVLQRNGRYEEALGVLDDLERVVEASQEGLPSIGGLYEKERKELLAQRAVVFGKLGRYDEAEQAYREWQQVGGNYTGDFMIIAYLMDRRRYDEVIRMCGQRERLLSERGDTVCYHMVALDRMLGEAYRAHGDYKRAAHYFEKLAVLTDSLKRRQQQSAAMDLAIANEVYEKERLLAAKDMQIRTDNILLVSALAIVFMLAVLLWRSLHYAHTIRRKNKVMVDTVAGMLAYKERLLHVGGQAFAPGQSLAGEGSAEASVGAVIPFDDAVGGASAADDETGRRLLELFEQLDRKVNEQRLFLDPGLAREDLMRLINVSKNQIAQVVQAGAGTNLAGYLNGLRLEYAARRLIRYPDYTVDAIAQEAGIPNLSSFHRLFKTRFGMTPTEFRRARCK